MFILHKHIFQKKSPQSRTIKDIKLFIDTRATYHLAYKKNQFINFEQLSPEKNKVHLGDDIIILIYR